MESRKLKKYVVLIFLISTLYSFACSGLQKSFCFIKASRVGDHVICGVISGALAHGISLNVIDVLSGIETRSTVTILDGTDFDCTGNISMKASLLGQVGDTIIVITPMIGGVPQNTWDVAGEYRMPYYLYETAWLKVSKDSVRGYIAGAANAPLLKYAYVGFKAYWQSHSNDCLTLNTADYILEKTKLVIQKRVIKIETLLDEKFLVKIFKLDGSLCYEAVITKEMGLDIKHLPIGLYILHLLQDSECILTKKIILQEL